VGKRDLLPRRPSSRLKYSPDSGAPSSASCRSAGLARVVKTRRNARVFLHELGQVRPPSAGSGTSRLPRMPARTAGRQEDRPRVVRLDREFFGPVERQRIRDLRQVSAPAFGRAVQPHAVGASAGRRIFLAVTSTNSVPSALRCSLQQRMLRGRPKPWLAGIHVLAAVVVTCRHLSRRARRTAPGVLGAGRVQHDREPGAAGRSSFSR